MATFFQFYDPYQAQPLFIDPHAFTLDQSDAHRSKTPTDSLVNHTGLSPAPLNTTPPLSRNSSQPPEAPSDLPTNSVLWDSSSFSDSPSSIRTPDGDSFEVELLDSESMRNFYHQTGDIMSTQPSHNTIPAIASDIFITPQGAINDQAIQAAFNATVASRGYRLEEFSIQEYRYQQSQPQRFTTLSSQDVHHYMGVSQPAQHDQWNKEGSSHSFVVSQSDQASFDPMNDLRNFAGILPDINTWTNNSTDPQFLISSSQPTLPPQDTTLFTTTQNGPHRHRHNLPSQAMHQSSVEMRLTGPTSPSQNQTFINYSASSSIFTDTYITSNQNAPQSPVGSSLSQYPQSPYQEAMSPSVASLVSSDGISSSYQHSDAGMIMDPIPMHQFEVTIPTISTSFNMTNSPVINSLGITYDHSPESETSRSASASRVLTKSGGRALGTHLEPTVAKAAHDMRKIVACWHCVIQRDKCGPGDVCVRCMKRSQRPNADYGLGCSRIKLVDLSTYFTPDLITHMHEVTNLTHFVTQYIHQWGSVELTVWMTCGQHCMPRIPVKVNEFVPRGDALLVQIQYRTDPTTHERIAIKKQSPALGMVHINHNDEKKYDKYISDIVDNHLDAFAELCWMEDDNDFQAKLFKLMIKVVPKNDDEAKLLREIFRLIVVTFIMSHTLTIAEESKFSTLSRMHSYGGQNNYVDNYTSPRLTNRQLKYFFSRLQRSIETTVLNKLQQIFKSSKGCDRWIAAFVAVLGMCMALEDQQKTIHLVMATKSATEKVDPRDAQKQADTANREIDAQMHFIQQIFRWKYNRRCNPLRDANADWEKEAGFGNASSVRFVRQAEQLVRENSDFLQRRQQVSIAPANQTRYTSRLVAQFLLSF